ncbi:uncharacterized protein VTP21DRAFT_7926 [Calcarisporiella thermophila]|uniref:uncharacterized protein n=1 Tax=Calcarisporiella thermophila TaxID=911321 RepID=UPI003742ABA4
MPEHHLPLSHRSMSPPAMHGQPLSPHSNGPRRSSGNMSMSVIEQPVTRLLVATKRLLENLTSWSQGQFHEEQIIDIYNSLVTHFNATRTAFQEAGIDMSDLNHIPEDLRTCVTAALKERPPSRGLSHHMPSIREVIMRLVHGLKQKQALYRERSITSERTGRKILRPSDGAIYQQQQQMQQQQQQQHQEHPSNRSFSDSFTTRPAGYSRPGGGAGGLHSSISQPSMRSANPALRPPPLQLKTSNFQQQGPLPSLTPPQQPQQSPLTDTRSSGGWSDQKEAEAIAALRRQEDLARRSSVRRTSAMYRASTMRMSDRQARRQTRLIDSQLPSTGAGQQTPPVPLQITPLREQVLAEESEDAATDASVMLGRRQAEAALGAKEKSPLVPIESGSNKETATSERPSSWTFYLQIGKRCKKAVHEGEVSEVSLRMLFIEKFNYNPRQDDFPSIYIRDPKTGITYELEDMSEVKDNSVLMLNIEELEQEHLKREIAEGFSNVNKDITELRKALEITTETLQQTTAQLQSKPPVSEPEPNPTRESAFTSAPEPTPAPAPASESASVPPPKPSDEDTRTLELPPPPPLPESLLPEAEKYTLPRAEKPESSISESKATEASREEKSSGPLLLSDKKAVCTALEAAQSEILQLQIRLTAISKTYSDFQQESRRMIKALVERAGTLDPHVEISKNRKELLDGKEKMLSQADTITGRLQDLQDFVDELKLDVTQRRSRPSENQLTYVQKEADELMTLIDEHGKMVRGVKPVWKRIWEEELQTIIGEQQLLKDQEDLLLDLEDDHESLMEVYANLRKVAAIQARAPPSPLEFRVPAPSDGHEGMASVLREVQTISVDHDKRLKAMAQAEKMRMLELNNRLDDFEKELQEFVAGGQLKKRGGAEEVERVRAQKNQEVLKALFTKGNPGEEGDIS